MNNFFFIQLGSRKRLSKLRAGRACPSPSFLRPLQLPEGEQPQGTASQAQTQVPNVVFKISPPHTLFYQLMLVKTSEACPHHAWPGWGRLGAGCPGGEW